jgi:hypothetical protein
MPTSTSSPLYVHLVVSGFTLIRKDYVKVRKHRRLLKN